MATFLYRLGRWAYDHRRAVLALWLAILITVGGIAAAFGGTKSNKFEVPGTESQQAQELLEERYPAASGSFARVVFAAPEGQTLSGGENAAAMDATLGEAKGAAEVSGVSDPVLSKDGTIGYADVIYPTPSSEISDEAREQLADVAHTGEAAGLQVEFSGGIAAEEAAHGSESLGMIVAFFVLAITMASLLAAGMPLLTAMLGVSIGLAGLTGLSSVIDLSETAPVLATMLGLAVGIDYALFILARHKQNLGDGMEPRESVAHASGTAGSAVVFAGLTVIIALVGLCVVNIPFLSVMGLAAAGTVAIAVLVALTLLPALLGFAGARLAKPNRLLAGRSGRKRSPLSARWVSFVVRRPGAVLLVGLALLGVAAVPAAHMELGLPDGSSEPTSSTERRSYDLLTAGFGPGFNGTLTVVVDAPEVARSEQEAFGKQVASTLEDFPGVAAVSPAMPNEAGDLWIVQVTPETGPATQETKDLVTALRTEAEQLPKSAHLSAYVTGQTAVNIDTADRLNEALPLYVGVVVGLALLLLMVVFRSVLVPLKAAAGFLLSIAASLGVTVWIFQDGNLNGLFDVASAGPIVSFLPILLIGILFGLAMDYEVFLVSRMRERFVHSRDAKAAVVKGYVDSGRVVTAAATIMMVVFGAYILSPDPIIKSIGLALAFGILADAFLVRLTLVPAVMALLGRRAWWMPKRVERLVPDLDIEGERLATAR
ncbi:MMPL family transporter [Solirubrobacter sp. CPCC 204708]|uniref:MMPL family transporter n=1 Tax=Solirubrobacter deserti TaxID=2282478 RepID=A0ABT4RLM8_9ACTN|nr:MMPL family transporter [Solirubrobacter deserti]MBE2318942.1 MMPL family transporter [Solirubrobacter deserti]MDA0139333.1 MMPL family transporter [Solirubrobacter deserti]